jgi:hypothetical protein
MYLCFQYPQNKDKNSGTFTPLFHLGPPGPQVSPCEKYSIYGIESSSFPVARVIPFSWVPNT